jgi:hypothetical protein
MVARVLVRWLGLPPSTVTYEDEAAFQHRYPSSLAWGQASAQGGGYIMTRPSIVSSRAKKGAQQRPK